MSDDSFTIQRAIQRVSEILGKLEVLASEADGYCSEAIDLVAGYAQLRESISDEKDSLAGLRAAGFELDGVDVAMATLESAHTEASQLTTMAAHLSEQSSRLINSLSSCISAVSNI